MNLKKLFDLVNTLESGFEINSGVAEEIKQLSTDIAKDYYEYGKYHAENFKEDYSSCDSLEDLINKDLNSKNEYKNNAFSN